MLVEHVFVTTLDQPAAMDVARQYMALAGFAVNAQTENSLTASRGGRRIDGRNMSTLPQDVHLTYDRGRVTVAAGIMPRNKKIKPVHSEMMLAMVHGLEAMLSRFEPPETAMGPWQQANDKLKAMWRRSNRIMIGCLGSIAALIILVVVLMVILSSR